MLKNAEGNPLFAAEIICDLQDSGALKVQQGEVVFTPYVFALSRQTLCELTS